MTQLHILERYSNQLAIGWKISETPDTAVKFTLQVSATGATWESVSSSIFSDIKGFYYLRVNQLSTSVDLSGTYRARVLALTASDVLVETMPFRIVGEDQVDWSAKPADPLNPDVQVLEDMGTSITFGVYCPADFDGKTSTYKLYLGNSSSTTLFKTMGYDYLIGPNWKAVRASFEDLESAGISPYQVIYMQCTTTPILGTESTKSTATQWHPNPPIISKKFSCSLINRYHGYFMVGWKPEDSHFAYRVEVSIDGVSFTTWKTITKKLPSTIAGAQGLNVIDSRDGTPIPLGLDETSEIFIRVVPLNTTMSPVVLPADCGATKVFKMDYQFPGENNTRCFVPYVRDAGIFQLTWTPAKDAYYYDVYLSWQGDQLVPPGGFVPTWTIFKRVQAERGRGLQVLDITQELLDAHPTLNKPVADKWWGRAIPLDSLGNPIGTSEHTDEAWPVYGGKIRIDSIPSTWFRDDMTPYVKTRTSSFVTIGVPPFEGEVLDLAVYVAPVRGNYPIDLRMVKVSAPNLPYDVVYPVKRDRNGWGEWVQIKITQSDFDSVFTGKGKLLVADEYYLCVVPRDSGGRLTTLDSPALLYVKAGDFEFAYRTDSTSAYRGLR